MAVSAAATFGLLGRLLERARDTVMAALVGLMVGSLRVLWPWPNGVGMISRHTGEVVPGTGLGWPADGEWLAPTGAAAAGLAAVLLLAQVARK